MLSSFLRFSVFVWVAENDSNTLFQWMGIFFVLKTVKKISVFKKKSGYVWTGPKIQNKKYFSFSFYRDINVMTSPLFTKLHHWNVRNESTIVFQKYILNNRHSLISC